MLKKVAFTMYPVIDLERARQFYEETLGLTVGKLSAEGKWVEYDLPGGGCFAITNLVEELEPASNSAGIAFEVDDIDAFMARLKEQKVEIKLDTFETPVCRMAVVIDTEGNKFMLHQLHRS